MSGQAYPSTVTILSATHLPFRVKLYDRQWVLSTKAGSIIDTSGNSEIKSKKINYSIFYKEYVIYKIKKKQLM